MPLRADRLQTVGADIVVTRDAQGRITNRAGQAFAIVENGDVVEAPLIVNGVEEARLRWVVVARPSRRGIAYLRLVAGDNCDRDTLDPPMEPEP